MRSIQTLARHLAAPLFALALALPVVALPATAEAQRFGAIAYSPVTGHWGWSTRYATRAQAESRAMAECRQHAHSGCRVALWFNNACGALARNSRGWGTGWGNDQARANREARDSCFRATYDGGGLPPPSCRVELQVCSH